jgi:hypothetical protein
MGMPPCQGVSDTGCYVCTVLTGKIDGVVKLNIGFGCCLWAFDGSCCDILDSSDH